WGPHLAGGACRAWRLHRGRGTTPDIGQHGASSPPRLPDLIQRCVSMERRRIAVLAADRSETSFLNVGPRKTLHWCHESLVRRATVSGSWKPGARTSLRSVRPSRAIHGDCPVRRRG